MVSFSKKEETNTIITLSTLSSLQRSEMIARLSEIYWILVTFESPGNYFMLLFP